MNRIYFVRHPDPGRAEQHHGIDFHCGRGSTSSYANAVRAVRGGCTLEDPADQAATEKAIAAEDQDKAEGVKRNREIEGAMEMHETRLHDSGRNYFPSY